MFKGVGGRGCIPSVVGDGEGFRKRSVHEFPLVHYINDTKDFSCNIETIVIQFNFIVLKSNEMKVTIPVEDDFRMLLRATLSEWVKNEKERASASSTERYENYRCSVITLGLMTVGVSFKKSKLLQTQEKIRKH